MPDTHTGSSSCFPLPLEHRLDTPMGNKSKCRNKSVYTPKWQWHGERMCIRTKTWKYGAFSWLTGLGDIYHFVDFLLKNIRPAIRTQTCLWASNNLGFLSCRTEKINPCSQSCREVTYEQQQRLGSQLLHESKRVCSATMFPGQECGHRGRNTFAEPTCAASILTIDRQDPPERQRVHQAFKHILRVTLGNL